MAYLRPISTQLMKDYAGSVALGTALALCMPLLGIAVLLLRGAVVAAAAVLVAIGATALAWRAIEPSLSPRWRSVVCNYAFPTALAISLVVCMPILGIVAFVVRGTVLALLIAAGFIVAVIAGWRAYTVRHPVRGGWRHPA
jgi:hypothetical protein